MGSLCEEDCVFFDACEEIASVSDDSASLNEIAGYDLWVSSPKSVQERRSKFFSWMGLEGQSLPAMPMHLENELIREEDEENREQSCSESYELTSDSVSSETAVSTSHTRSMHELNECTSSPRRFKNWLNILRSITCVVDKQQFSRNEAESPHRIQRVKVTQSGKRFKELSAVYAKQDIQAHFGAILAMKFSPDGQFLASAGVDGVLRVWKVVEDERSNEFDIPEINPSCIYFTVNHLSELKPLITEKEKSLRHRSMRKTSESACVIFPPKMFSIIEKPVHEFHGHSAEILDLSWSSNNHLLSASVDKTVRLWMVGCDDCLRVFSHSNYVTCVQFNPADEHHFISGSIDGKVRIWDISSHHVVDYSDAKDIITAVSYRPDGQGGIIGFMDGKCRFYTISENRLQIDKQISLNCKKKSPCRRITGFYFFPENSTKVMVTCADSQVRILEGEDVITKYKSSKSSGNMLSASVTSSRRHIISASEDSHVYVWNHADQVPFSRTQKIMKSSERFPADASIAIPWCGFRNGNSCFSPSSFSISQEYILESFHRGSATWPEEKLRAAAPLTALPSLHSSRFSFLKSSCQNSLTSHAWGLVIVTAGLDGRIKSFQNYGLPVAQGTG